MNQCANYIIKSPLNYIGGKQRILKQLLPIFPSDIRTFVDLFAGGGNVGINVKAQKIILNDNLTYLIDLFKALQRMPISKILSHINMRILDYKLSLTNEEGYKQLRALYNKDKNPLDLFVLISFSFNHQIRFNNSHEFNNPFGKNRSCFNNSIQKNLEDFTKQLQSNKIELLNKSFENFDFHLLNSNDFVYCDPPYLITTGTYNDGKRGFKGWGINEELILLSKLDLLNKKGIKFALSNVLEHKGKTNKFLVDWLKDNQYLSHPIVMNYANANYHTIDKNKNSTTEVVITNYMPEVNNDELPLLSVVRQVV